MFAEIDTGDHRSPEEIRVAVASSRKERRNKENAGGWATEANEDRKFKSRKRSARCPMEGRPMNAGRFVIDGLAIPANRKAQRYREYPIGPAPGSVGLARSLFSYSNLGGGGRLACGVRGSAAGFESCVHTSKTIVRGGTLSAVHTVLVLVRRSRARHSRFRGPPPPLRFRKFRSVEELERRRLYRNTRNDVVGLCSVSRLGCPIKQGGGKWIWGGVQWITKKKKKDSSGWLWQCSDLLIVICFCSTSLRIRSYLRFFRVNYSLWRKTRRESQPRHQNWAGLAPTGRRPLYEVSLYCLLLDLVRALEDVWTLVERCLKLV